MIIAGLLALALVPYAWARRRFPGALNLAALLLMIGWWAGLLGVESLLTDLETKALVQNFAHIGGEVMGVLWLEFVLRYIHARHSLLRGWLRLTLVVPAVTVVLLVTQPLHGWIYGALVYLDGQWVRSLEPWYWVTSGHSYALLVVALWLLVRYTRTTSGLDRLQALLLLGIQIIPFGTSILINSIWHPLSVDLTPLALLISGLLTCWAILHLRLLDLAPLARTTVVDRLAEAVLVLDEARCVVDANLAAERVLGHPASVLVGQALTPALTALLDCHPLPCGEHYLPCKDGKRWFEPSVTRLYNRFGLAAGWVLVLRDVTETRAAHEELRRAKEAAEYATRVKSEFLAVMSHEIRTPMNGVIGMTSLLLTTPLSREQRDFVETIRGSGQLLLTLVSDILDFSKIEAGRLELEHAPFDLHETLHSVAQLFRQNAADRGIALTLNLGPHLPRHVLGDVTRLRQVLSNLISNALKFTHEGGVILRATHEKGTADRPLLVLAVEDTGIGIPEDRLAHIFEAFTQVDASTTREYGGTGLGLAISQRLCERMGGRIEVRSTVGQGSTFQITLPVEVAKPVGEEALPKPLPVVPLTTRSVLRVLLAEDNIVNRKMAMHMLNKLGHLVTQATNGREAIDAIAAEPFDVVLMDVQMPEVDGLTAMREIRTMMPADRQPHIIALTASVSELDRERCMDAGADDYLPKPVQLDELHAALLMAKPELASEAAPGSAVGLPEVAGVELPLR